MKACTKCGGMQPLSAFPKRGRGEQLSSHCNACKSAYKKARRAANPEAAREADRARVRDTEKISEQGRVRYAANREAFREKRKADYERNRNAEIARSRAFAKAHPQRQTEYKRTWRARHPEKYAAIQNARRTRLRDGSVGVVDLAALWDDVCVLCGDELTREFKFPHAESPSVEHLTPLSRGGSHTQDNLGWAHLLCNQLKGDRLITEAL